jgi:hypothetical protein
VVIYLAGLVGQQNVRGVLQVPLGQPEVVLGPVSLESDKVFWSFVRTDQSVGDDILHLEFFFVIH